LGVHIEIRIGACDIAFIVEARIVNGMLAYSAPNKRPRTNLLALRGVSLFPSAKKMRHRAIGITCDYELNDSLRCVMLRSIGRFTILRKGLPQKRSRLWLKGETVSTQTSK